ncbi:MAG TPA: PIG-L deacetylase family protein [Hyphomicrobiaceae bacterium]|nr:PIG-L deacetylase family protein [Hyphomicrobiaceae bacterium]
MSKTGLVVSALSADFVWRCGGAIALHAERGYAMTVVCLSFGERGESEKLWRQKGITLDEVKASRRREAENAAKALGVAELQFFDMGDYPMRVTDEYLYRLVDVYRTVKPAFVLSHSLADPYNFDHPLATHMAQEARIIAQAHGHNPGEGVLGAPPVFLFEPHQPEQCGWKPDVLLDITSVWGKKRAAIECMTGQEHLWEYYTGVAQRRGNQCRRNGGNKSCTHAEGYQSIFPSTPELLA